MPLDLENLEKALNFEIDLENLENQRNLLRKILRNYFTVVFFLNLLLLTSERTKTRKKDQLRCRYNRLLMTTMFHSYRVVSKCIIIGYLSCALQFTMIFVLICCWWYYERAHCAQFFAPSAILSCARCSSVRGISHWHAVLLTIFYV